MPRNRRNPGAVCSIDRIITSLERRGRVLIKEKKKEKKRKGDACFVPPVERVSRGEVFSNCLSNEQLESFRFILITLSV